jgi:SAM-dependent methyltransferase
MGEQPVDGVDIGWEDARAANLANWEDRVPLHVESYATEALVDDPAHLSSVIRTDLEALEPYLEDGTIEGLDLCHLQCHIGTDTLSLAKAGATVVGVDFSPAALAAARALVSRLGIEAEWVETDVLDARAAIDREIGAGRLFDVVYTSIGTICWLHDLDRWAAQIEALLKPGGIFYIRDGHPALYALDDQAEGLSITHRYFGDGGALQWDDEGTYAGDGHVEHSRTYEWPHPISEVVTVLLRHGLTLLALDEGRTLPWQFAPRMTVTDDGDYVWPDAESALVPCTFTVVARRD